MYPCVCGAGPYPTLPSLKQHQRRYCRGPPLEMNDQTCPQCRRIFATFRGMRQHLKQSHLGEYNEELYHEARSARSRWTNEEVEELARSELTFDGVGHMNSELGLRIGRSEEAMKKRRQGLEYRQELMNLQEFDQTNAQRHPKILKLLQQRS